MASLDRYIYEGVPTGDFLRAVLENNLRESIGRADQDNLTMLPHIVAWLYNEAPSKCWGAPTKVDEWLVAKTLERTTSHDS